MEITEPCTRCTAVESCVKFFENSFPFEGKWSILNNTVNAEYIPLWYEQTSPDMVSGSR